jgi:hypothetical protein
MAGVKQEIVPDSRIAWYECRNLAMRMTKHCLLLYQVTSKSVYLQRFLVAIEPAKI